MKNLLKIGAISALAAILMSTAAFAGTTLKYYDEIVGKFNGSAYTEYQTKTTTGVAGRIRSGGVGGEYVVDVRMQHNSAHGDWVRDLDDGNIRNLPAPDALAAGQKVQMKFSNDLTTPVAVQVWGKWRSN